jgi:hypothetical protein
VGSGLRATRPIELGITSSPFGVCDLLLVAWAAAIVCRGWFAGVFSISRSSEQGAE